MIIRVSIRKLKNENVLNVVMKVTLKNVAANVEMKNKKKMKSTDLLINYFEIAKPYLN
jgi:hypothetical protein